MDAWTRSLVALAGLMGAFGVAAAAAAAHIAGGALLETAAHFLLVDAVALVALAGLGAHLSRGRTLLLAGASLIGLGTLLFSGDLALRALRDVKLLGGSAPFGGGTMIFGWLTVAAAALFARR